ncbi:hypothetical protein DNH61_10975 [Paenibacillus sambharensis]|uniref:DUF2179 domain-containing protein n=1 Tax=Paenibacillus sambharensis TaxID=1803190 RepID=A0A2W1LMD1_9BACL|nr:YitT family protein [Paenibacillus sambharensis]PZD96035.1 hypothetical protein DNH61_10975 [Paenibacillus sambharensis]
MTIGALLIAIGFNMLLIPHQLLSGGVSGISMIISYVTVFNISLLYFVLNFPILVWGWFVLGRHFVAWSVYSVVAATVLLEVVPVKSLVMDPMLGAVFGGVIFGFGSGVALRLGGSSGGFDIVASIVTRKRDLPLGMLLFILNGAVIAALALMNNDWDAAMYSMLAIFTAGKVIDVVHIRHMKVTAFIITNETEKLLAKLLATPRGVTIIKTRGAYAGAEKDMLMTVTTRYELAALRKMIRQLDPKAFVNIVETVGVIGEFRRG